VRTLSRREKGLLGLVALTAVVLAVLRFNNPAGAPAAHARGDEPLPSPVPRIDLARLSAERPDTTAGHRDLFRFGAGRNANAEAESEAAHQTAPTPTPPVETVYVPTPPPGPPPLQLHYLGSIENRAGVKVAVLMTDRREVLTAQAGELVANRYRIARIGLESVDLEDVGSGQSRRIPLRGN
jgi:hypothetical protein